MHSIRTETGKVVLYPKAEPYESIAIDFRQEKAPS
jgi:hypothetical protein